MVTKLTLTMDKDVIEKAKEYAAGKNKSLSKLVEGYLGRISTRDMHFDPEAPIKSAFLDSMTGMFHDDGRDYKELREEAITERYGMNSASSDDDIAVNK
jgi:hypothetical protein